MKVVRLTISTPYRYGEDKIEKREEDFVVLEAFCKKHNLKFEKPDSEYVTDFSYFTDGDTVVDVMTGLVDGITFKSVEKIMDTSEPHEARLKAILDGLEVAVNKMEKQSVSSDGGNGPVWEHSPGWNEKCFAPLSGPVLHSFNQLRLLEDSCTDALQEALDDGWRMVAICPQESRRPDYVLGRFLPTHITGKQAQR